MNKFMGKEGFYWWQGVVEDRMDPLMCGRCRVRILGIHTDDKTNKGIPTEHLPWATILLPVNQEERIVPPKEGSWVMGFFRDAEGCQDPVIMGVIPGIPTEENPNFGKAKQEQLGFYDPGETAGTRPIDMETGFMIQNTGGPTETEAVRTDDSSLRQSNIYPKHVGEPDTHRLARNENTENTVLQWKIENRFSAPVNTTDTDGNVSISNWVEPDYSSIYGTRYPYNKVMASESGHVLEIDDTPNHERIHTFHRSGTFDEMHPNGDRVMKTIGSTYRITYGNDHYVCMGVKYETFGGNKTNHYYGQMGQIVGDKKYTYAHDINTNVTAGSYQNYSGTAHYVTIEGNDGTDNENAYSVLAERGNVRITARNEGNGELHLKSDNELKLDSNDTIALLSHNYINTQAEKTQTHTASSNYKINTGGVFMVHSSAHAEVQSLMTATINSNIKTNIASNAMTLIEAPVVSVGGLVLLGCIPPIVVPVVPQPAQLVSPATSADHAAFGDANIPTPSSLNSI